MHEQVKCSTFSEAHGFIHSSVYMTIFGEQVRGQRSENGILRKDYLVLTVARLTLRT